MSRTPRPRSSISRRTRLRECGLVSKVLWFFRNVENSRRQVQAISSIADKTSLHRTSQNGQRSLASDEARRENSSTRSWARTIRTFKPRRGFFQLLTTLCEFNLWWPVARRKFHSDLCLELVHIKISGSFSPIDWGGGAFKAVSSSSIVVTIHIEFHQPPSTSSN